MTKGVKKRRVFDRLVRFFTGGKSLSQLSPLGQGLTVALIAFPIGYFFMPFSLIPNYAIAFGPFTFIDDVFLLATTILIARRIGQEMKVVRRTRRLAKK